MIDKPREDQKITQVQVQQILNPPDVEIPNQTNKDPLTNPSENNSKPGTAQEKAEVVSQGVASSCNEEMIAYIDDQ